MLNELKKQYLIMNYISTIEIAFSRGQFSKGFIV